MPTYPPAIRHDDFRDAIPPVPYQVQDPLRVPSCALTGLGLVQANQAQNVLSNDPKTFLAARSFVHSAQPHNELAAGALGRFQIAPGVDNLELLWTFSEPQHINSASLELFRRSAQAEPALWTTAVILVPGQASGRMAFNGDLGAGAVGAILPDGCLTAEHAPYKLRMTIVPAPNVWCQPWLRWIYIDVVVADIRIFLGGATFVPQEPQLQDAGYNRRNTVLHEKMEDNLKVNNHSVAAADAPTITIPLDGNIFGVTSADWSDNSAFTAWRALWRDGPYIPLVAEARVLNAAGQPTVAPLALGNARFLWDWSGGQPDLANVSNLARQAITQTYQYRLQDCPTGQQNAHKNVGGKRGPNARLFKATDGSGFPFRVEACSQRLGAAFSYAGTQPNTKAQTGVVFCPSIIAGDKYTLTVYFAYGDRRDWDVNSTAAELARALPSPVPKATTGEFVVERVVRVAAHWRMNPNVELGTFTWDGVKAYFKQANITLDTEKVQNNPTTIDAAQFRWGFRQGLQLLAHSVQLAFAPDRQQANDRYGIRCISYSDFKTEVAQRYNTRCAGIITLGLPQQGNAVLNALDRIQARLELYLELAHGQVQNQGAPPAPGHERTITDQYNNFGLRQQVFNNQQDLEVSAKSTVFQLLIRAGMDATPAEKVAKGLTHNATQAGERDVVARILTLAGLETEEKYQEKCKGWGRTVLTEACAYISANNLPNTDGVQVFQFDFQDNFDNFSASGWAFQTASNRTQCPECGRALDQNDRERRVCPQCQARLRTNASIMTLVPWKYMRSFSPITCVSLNKNKGQYWLLSNMDGVRPEILVAHEVGHHLFLPHAPFGFIMPNPTPTTPVWSMLEAAVWIKPTVRQQINDLTEPGGNKRDYHATSNTACIMGYNFAQMPYLHFCAKCALRLRGWDGPHIQGLNL